MARDNWVKEEGGRRGLIGVGVKKPGLVKHYCMHGLLYWRISLILMGVERPQSSMLWQKCLKVPKRNILPRDLHTEADPLIV